MPALSAGLVALLVVKFSWTLAVIALYWCIRLLTTREVRLLVRTVVVVTVTAIAAGFFVITCQRQTPVQPRRVHEQFLVWPDQIQTNGNLVFADGRALNSNQKVHLSYSAKSRTELAAWQQVNQPVVVQARGQRQALLPATNFNQFDVCQYYYAQRISSELRAEAFRINRVVPPTTPSALCHTWRMQAHQYFQQLPSPLCEYADQLIIGYRVVNSDWQTAVKQLGIIHLFCLSGMHVVLLTELLRRLMTYCHLSRETIDLILILGLPSYLILGGGSASLVRAVIMAECRLMAPILKTEPLDGWSWGLIIGCWLDPFVLTNLGGQMSYLLSLLLHLIEEDELRRTLLLNLAGLPLIFNSVFEVHLVSFVMSYLVSPLFSLFIFPGTLLTTACFHFWMGPALLFNQCLQLLHRLLISCTKLPGMICFGKPPEWAVWLLLILTLLALDQPFTSQRFTRLGIAYGLVFIFIHFPLSGEVTFVDVGQGDSIIIKTPFNRRVVMIDTGGRLAFRRPRWAQLVGQRAPAEKTSLNYLKSRGINHLDALFLSHSDSDHIGDVPVVVNEMKVKRIYVPVGMEKMAKFQRYLPADSTVAVWPTRSGEECENLLQALHPSKPGRGGNGDSLTLLGRFGSLNFLFTGDLDQQGERQVVKEYPDLKVDVLKLGHHGSRTASGKSFLSQVAPRWGIISAGRFNRYGHPHNVTVHRLRSQQIKAMSTQQYGMIRYRYVGQHGHFETKLRGDELTWMLPPYSNS